MNNSHPRGCVQHLRWKPSEGGRSKAEQSPGCQQDLSLTIPYPLVTGYMSATIRNRVQNPNLLRRGGNGKGGNAAGRDGENRRSSCHGLFFYLRQWFSKWSRLVAPPKNLLEMQAIRLYLPRTGNQEPAARANNLF